MVKKCLLMAGWVLVGWPLQGFSAPKTCGTETTPCEHPRRLGAVRSVQITQGAHPAYPTVPAQSCDRFVLRLSQATRYLQMAGQTTANAQHHVTDESACVVTGQVKLVNGQMGTWVIGEEREGRLVWPDGRVEYLYCSRCPSPPLTPM